MIGIGLLGAGRIGRMHARNLAAHPRVNLAGIFDIDSETGQQAASETGCRFGPTAASLLEDPQIDAVFIASATDTHCDLIEAAASAGKAVFCEKPIHLDLARVDECARVVREAGITVQIGFNRRFDPSHAAVREAVGAGEIGRIEQAVITSRDPAPPPLDYVRVSGGLFRDMAIHDFDMARFLFAEEPAEVTAMGSVLVDASIGEAGDIDTAMVVMRMESGALCHINCSRRSVYGYDQRIELFGERGMLVSNNPTPTNVERYSSGATEARPVLYPFFIERYAESYVREIDAFVDALEANEPASPSFEDGRRALLLADAAADSASSGRSIAVKY